MEKIKVIWTYSMDIICVPEIISENLQVYTDEFREWVSGMSFDDKITDATCFGIQQYVFFLNDRYLSDYSEKVYVEYENYVPKTKHEIQQLKKMKKVYF